MICIKCGDNYPKERFAMGFDTCVSCSETEMYGAVAIVNHKTGNTVQPLPKEQAIELNKMANRQGYGASKGMTRGGSKNYTYNPRQVKHKVRIFNPSATIEEYEKIGEKMMLLLDVEGYESALNFIKNKKDTDMLSGIQFRQLNELLNTVNQIS